MSTEIFEGKKSQYKLAQTKLNYGFDNNIYKGEDLNSKEKVAIQIQKINKLEQYNRQQKILEVIMAQGQSLKNVIHIVDVFELEIQGQRTLFTVMEQAGSDFRCFLRYYEYYPKNDEIYKVQLMCQIICGVQELHQLGITHNGIHWKNMLCFEQESGYYILNICDFTHAKQVNSNGEINNKDSDYMDECYFKDIQSTCKILRSILKDTPRGIQDQLMNQNWIKKVIRSLKILREIENILQPMDLRYNEENSDIFDILKILKGYKEICSIIQEQTSYLKEQLFTNSNSQMNIIQKSFFTSCLEYFKTPISQQQQGFNAAIKCYDEGIKQNPSEFRIYELKALALIQINRLDDVIKCWEEGIDKNPSEIQFYQQKGIQYLGEIQLKHYFDLVKQGGVRKQNRLEDIIKTWNKGIRKNPQCQKFFELKVEQLIEQNRLNEVIECLDEAITANPREIEFYGRKASVLHEQNRLEEMVQCCLEGMRIDRCYATLSYLLSEGIKNSILLVYTLVVLDQCIRQLPNRLSNKNFMLEISEKVYKIKSEALAKLFLFRQAILSERMHKAYNNQKWPYKELNVKFKNSSYI